METATDFLLWLESDMSRNILMCLNDPADLVRASAVSRFWHDFVVTNGLFKQLSLKMFPQLSSIAHIVEANCGTIESSDIRRSSSLQSEIIEREHKVYASLLHALTTRKLLQSCIASAVSASSTDNFPVENIGNTLIPRDRFLDTASYWSSKGHHDPNKPETLLYKLKANFCLITDISLRPFEAFFQPGNPIYSAKSVRFRMGHPKCLKDIECDLQNLPLQQPIDEKFIWTYTSQEFPMTQENKLQHFKLPEPVLCIGGFLQIELLGRVQRQEVDFLFYICVSHIQVLGRPLSPAFEIEILEPSGTFLLRYNSNAFDGTLLGSSNDEDGEPARMPEEILLGHVDLWEYLMGGNQPGAGADPADWDDDDNEFDEMVLL